jgi:iron(III) transport system permease protein
VVSGLIVGLYATIVAGCFVKNWGIDYSFTLVNIGEALTRGRQALVSTITLAESRRRKRASCRWWRP